MFSDVPLTWAEHVVPRTHPVLQHCCPWGLSATWTTSHGPSLSPKPSRSGHIPVGPGSPSKAGNPSPALETAPASSSQNINIKTLTHSLPCIYSFTPSLGAGEVVPGSSSLSHHLQLLMTNVNFTRPPKSPCCSQHSSVPSPKGCFKKPFFPPDFPGETEAY